MGNPVKQRGCHFGITKDSGPFAELQIGGDNDTGVLIKFGDQVEQKRSA